MQVSSFTVSSDIVGRRVRISWDFVPGAAETLGSVPPVTLHRKLRDFNFPASDPAKPDPYLVYDAGAFPPAPAPGGLTVTDLETWQVSQDGLVTIFEPISVAVATAGGRFVEILRRT